MHFNNTWPVRLLTPHNFATLPLVSLPPITQFFVCVPFPSSPHYYYHHLFTSVAIAGCVHTILQITTYHPCPLLLLLYYIHSRFFNFLLFLLVLHSEISTPLHQNLFPSHLPLSLFSLPLHPHFPAFLSLSSNIFRSPPSPPNLPPFP